MSDEPKKPLVHELRANDFWLGQDQPKPKRMRKPRLDKTIADAEKTGKVVASITTPDGVTLTFELDKPASTEPSTNPWLLDLDKKVCR